METDYKKARWRVARYQRDLVILEGNGARVCRISDGWPAKDRDMFIRRIVESVNEHDELHEVLADLVALLVLNREATVESLLDTQEVGRAQSVIAGNQEV